MRTHALALVYALSPDFRATLALLLLLIVAVPVASAEERLEIAGGELTTEAFANLTAGRSVNEDTAAGDDLDGRVDGQLRLLGLYQLGNGTQLGARVVVVGASGYGGDEDVDFGERSLLVLGDWGRLEIGWRMGLPDVLTGYAPNNFTFTGAEYGPASGRSLDPGEQLATSFLSPELARRIDALSFLGFTSAFFNDQSEKIIYVSPKYRGFLGGLSYSDDVEEPGDHFGALYQAGLTHETYSGQNVYRVGGSFAYAEGQRSQNDLHSLSLGTSAVLDDAWMLGVNLTWNGDSGLPEGSGGDRSDVYGATASVNYNRGPWTVGGYAQTATAEGDLANPHDDRLNAYSLGASYRTSTRVRLYGAYYHYRLRDEGSGNGPDRFDGGVLLIGTRFTL